MSETTSFEEHADHLSVPELLALLKECRDMLYNSRVDVNAIVFLAQRVDKVIEEAEDK